jgi:hypothetical protein
LAEKAIIQDAQWTKKTIRFFIAGVAKIPVLVIV